MAGVVEKIVFPVHPLDVAREQDWANFPGATVQDTRSAKDRCCTPRNTQVQTGSGGVESSEQDELPEGKKV